MKTNAAYNMRLALQRTIVYAFFIIMAAISLVPIWIMVINSTRSSEEIQNGISFLPSVYFFENWDILTGRGFMIARGFLNSSSVALSTTVVAIY
jgi:multiple sugar transport system permease protein